ncbi:MAG: hypothetical protein R3E97_13935 [Candidatus Eisenbacteria bacterium]
MYQSLHDLPGRPGRFFGLSIALLVPALLTCSLGLGFVSAAGIDAATPPGGTPTAGHIPMWSECTISPCDELQGLVLSPNVPSPIPASVVESVIRNEDGIEMENVTVVFDLSTNDPCRDVLIQGLTDENGRVTLVLPGGGCAEGAQVRVKANGVTIRIYESAKSPDFDGAGGSGAVDIADLVDFTGEFLGTQPAGCHDYDNTGATNLGDLIIFAPAFAAANHCQ